MRQLRSTRNAKESQKVYTAKGYNPLDPGLNIRLVCSGFPSSLRLNTSMRNRFLFALFFLFSAGPAGAHPLTDVRFSIGRAAVRLSRDGVEVTYTLEVSQLALYADAAQRLNPAEIAALDRTPIGFATAYAKKVALELTDKFKAKLDGTTALAQGDRDRCQNAIDHAVCRFTLKSDWPPGNAGTEADRRG